MADAAPEDQLHPAVRGLLAVSFLDRNGRRKMPTFAGPDATERAWAEFQRRDALAVEYGRERPRIMRWNGATWTLHHEAGA